ncbi:hypothetical protein RN001_014540 [Aquatica leii]|uniref:MULE transposase domain-containing protein n=1 Tax=Aquatica leii TaxID=1421715 RepID=A0AAN7P223_9COLE|nr:hypothetical protein RN001_014540 [Aquatica leii]
MVDFERASINAVTGQFPEATLCGCFFHFTHCIWRHIQEAGLQQRYNNDPDFALQLKQLAALAFVPEDHLIASYKELIDCEFYTDNENILLPVTNYFEDTWIGRLDRRRRRQPLFPINMWNIYSKVVENLPRTNNAVEGWHNSFASTLNANYSCIWRFIKALKKEYSLNCVKIEQLIAGNIVPQGKVYKDTAQRIQNIVADYENRPIMEYLRRISHNFQFQV